MAQRRVLVRCTLLCMVRRLRLTAVVGSRTKKKKMPGTSTEYSMCVFLLKKCENEYVLYSALEHASSTLRPTI